MFYQQSMPNHLHQTLQLSEPIGDYQNEGGFSANACEEDDQSESINPLLRRNVRRPRDWLLEGDGADGLTVRDITDVPPHLTEGQCGIEDSLGTGVSGASPSDVSFLPSRSLGVLRSCISKDTPGEHSRDQDLTRELENEKGLNSVYLDSYCKQVDEKAGKYQYLEPNEDIDAFTGSMHLHISDRKLEEGAQNSLAEWVSKTELADDAFQKSRENYSRKNGLPLTYQKSQNKIINYAIQRDKVPLETVVSGNLICGGTILKDSQAQDSQLVTDCIRTVKVKEQIKVTSLKDLLAVFGIPLKEKTFSHEGFEYLVALEDQTCVQCGIDQSAPIAKASEGALQIHSYPQNHSLKALQDIEQSKSVIKEDKSTGQSQLQQAEQAVERKHLPVTEGLQSIFVNQFTDLQRQETGELVDIDRLVLSSPTNDPNLVAASGFLRSNLHQALTTREDVQVADKEVQCDIIQSTISSQQFQERSIAENADHQMVTNVSPLSGGNSIPSLRNFMDDTSQIQEPPPEDDYYKRIQEQMAREIAIQEQIHDLNNISDPLSQNVASAVTAITLPENSSPPLIKNQLQNIISNLISNSNSLDEDLAALSSITLKRAISLGEDHLAFRKNIVEAKNIDKLKSENEKLIEELQKANSQIQSKFFLGAGGRFDGRLHLAFLFATPLVVKRGVPLNSRSTSIKSLYKIQPLLQYEKEFQNIRSSLMETKKHVKIMSQQATINSLSKILSQNPVALHFTGHGLERKSLLLEAEDGEGVELNEVELRGIIAKSNVNIEFVFVASCFSEFAGKVFFNAGVKHVICVKQGNTIDDGAVLTFSRAFYFNLVSQNQTVCQAYQIAKNMVQAEYGPTEAQKFSIFTHKETYPLGSEQQPLAKPIVAKPKRSKNSKMPIIDEDDEFNIALPEPIHTCKVFGPFDQGKVEILDTKAQINEFPTAIDNFIGRQIEIFEVVHAVCNHRLVNIIGLPGIGKTALAKNAVNYIAQRKMFKHGIIFLSLKGYKHTDVFIKRLVSGVLDNSHDQDLEKSAKSYSPDSAGLLKRIISYFKESDEELLIVFDNAEELLYHDKKGFQNLVTQILHNCTQITFLMTSRLTLGVLQDIQEKVIVLSELSPVSSVDLFFSRAREVSEEEKVELIKFQPKEKMLVSDSAHTHNTQTTNLAKHHLFKILSGNPHAIILAVPHLMKRTLKELYELLNSEQLHQVLQEDGVQDSTVASLCLSIELSIMMLQEEDQNALSLFYLVGLLPGGILRDELQHIWINSGEQTDCDKCVQKLMDLSLIQIKEQAGDKGCEQKLILPPFINSYAEQTIDVNLKQGFSQNLCRYYAKYLREIYREDFNECEAKEDSPLCESNSQTADVYKTPSPQLEQQHIQEMRSRMIIHETNILACIYRLAKSDIPIQIEEFETNLTTSKPVKPKESRNIAMTPTHKKRSIVKVLERKQSSADTELEKKLDLAKAQLYPSKVISEEGSAVQDNQSDFSISFNHLAARQRHKSRAEENPYLFESLKKLQDDEESGQTSDDCDEEDAQSPASSDFEGDADQQEDLRELEDIGGIQIAANNPEVKRMDQLPLLETPSDQHEDKPKIEIKAATFLASAIKEGKNKLMNVLQNSIINKIVRNSFVVFKPQRASILRRPSQALKQAQIQEDADSDEDMYVPKKYNSIADILPNIQPLIATSTLSEPEKLIIYYGMNLYLLKDEDSALKIFEKYQADYQGSALFEANVTRLLGMIHLRKGDLPQATKHFQEALAGYSLVQSIYGLALCKFSMGVISMTGNCISESIDNFQQALTLFQESNHIIGQAICLDHMSEIFGLQGNDHLKEENARLSQQLQRDFESYRKSYKMSCRHVPRIYGKDISLMSEIVLNNENRDLFPDIKNPTKSPFPRLEKSAGISSKAEQANGLSKKDAQSVKTSAFFGFGKQTIEDQSSTIGMLDKRSISLPDQAEDSRYQGRDDETGKECSNLDSGANNLAQIGDQSTNNLQLVYAHSAPLKTIHHRAQLEVVQEEEYKLHEHLSGSDDWPQAEASPQSLGIAPKSPKSAISSKCLLTHPDQQAESSFPTKTQETNGQELSQKLSSTELLVDSISLLKREESIGLKSPIGLMETGIGFGKTLIGKLMNLNSRTNSQDDQ